MSHVHNQLERERKELEGTEIFNEFTEKAYRPVRYLHDLGSLSQPERLWLEKRRNQRRRIGVRGNHTKFWGDLYFFVSSITDFTKYDKPITPTASGKKLDFNGFVQNRLEDITVFYLGSFENISLVIFYKWNLLLIHTMKEGEIFTLTDEMIDRNVSAKKM